MNSHFIYNKVSGILMSLMMLMGLQAYAQTHENVLVVNDFEAQIGKAVEVPIYMNNSDEVIAAQFDIQLPFAVPSNATATLSNRSDQHSVSFREVGSKTYRVVIMTMQNHPLRGNAGLLLRMPMQTYDDGNTTTPYPITLSNIVLTDIEGNNIATSSTAKGNFTVYRGTLPDLTVEDVSPQTAQCAPGGQFSVSYQVKNIGNGATGAGWTERIYLEGTNGTRTYIGSQQYVSTLAAGSSQNRTFSSVLPTLLHIDGEARVMVEIVPGANTGELMADQGNNTRYSASYVMLSKCIYLSTDKNTVREGSSYATLTLSRSGDWSTAETFTISCSVSNLFTCNGMTMPCTVTIPARSSGTTLRIAAVDDNIVRAREADITVSGANGYNSVSLHLNRIDNDRNPLSLSLSPTTLAEGGQLTVIATRGGELTDELDLNIACSHANRFDQPFTVHFNRNQQSVRITTTAINDDTPQLDANVRFSASATDYQTASTSLLLTDDDRPTLTLSLSRPSIMENAASDEEAQPLVATITRNGGTEQDITVWLTSSSNEAFFENNKVVIPAGKDQIEVPMSVVDNSRVDGQRTVTLTAALYLPADLKAAPAGDRAYSQCKLTIIDDETPYLALSSRVTAVGEGSSATLTVRRYVSNTSSPLSVTLSCDDPRVSFSPQPVTIAAGNTQATVTMSVARNSQENDDNDIVVTAKATGVSDAAFQLHITDRTLPDAVNPSIEVVGAPFYSGLPATVRATIRNYGTSVLPKGMTIDFYLANTSQMYYYTRSIDFFQATTDKEIPAGGEQVFEFNAQLPQEVGSRWIYARLNADNKIQEFSTGNNLTQKFCPITIAAPFEVETITAEPEDGLPGCIVTVKGRMKAVEGSYLNRQTVRVELKGTGQRTTAETKIDTEGNFNVSVKADRSACGYLTVNALALGQTEPAKTTRVHIYNMSLSASSTRWTVDENIAKQGTIQLRNTSAKPITITELTTTTPLPDGMELQLNSSVGTIAAGNTANIAYTVKGTKPSAQRQEFTITARSQEGLVAQLPISYFCQATNAHLVFTPRELRTTMLYNADRENVIVTVKNVGKKASGKISELISDEWVMSDFGNNRTLQPGEEATIHLTFLAQDYMHTGRTYKTFLQLTPENGTAASLPITVTTTGNEYAQFDLYAADVYSKANDDYSRLAGGSVTVTNARTKATVMTGTLDMNGHWQTMQMQEGLYDVTVKAARHLTVTKQIAVGPGEDTQLNVTLPYRAVLADFVVDQDLNTNTYTMKQYFNVDQQAPQAIILAEIADEGFGCGSETMEIVLRNVGSRAATGVRLLMPVASGYTFTQTNDLPVVMQPGDVHVLQMHFDGPASGTHRVISTIRLHYKFDINGETLSEDDNYQSLVGCTQSTDKPTPPVVNPEPPYDPDDPSDSDDPDNGGKGKGGSGGTALPTYGCFATLEFENLTDIRCGQPLHAVLTVRNGQQQGALRSLRFSPQVSDTNYEDRTSLFAYAEGEQEGFTTDATFRQLAAGKEGTLNLTFTPQADAAANGPQTYYIGGQLTYIDGRTNIRSAASLPLIQITVQPSGDVQLTYLIQRHFLSDDTYTDNVVEQPEPAVFALLARNLGPVAVSRLQLSATQPVVVGNTSAKPVPYTAQYAAVNRQEGNFTFADFALDTIDGGSTAAARWIYTSDLSAHVRSMEQITRNVTATQGSGASVIVGQPRCLTRPVASRSITATTPSSEADELELKIQALTEGDAYLLNDVDDEESLPDAVLTADGQEYTLQTVSRNSTLTQTGGNGDYTLTVRADAAGWIYGQLHDPTNGIMRLETVTRLSDGQKVSLANFWQTDRTPQPDFTMMEEYKLHFADMLYGTEETYQLHFVARPSDEVRLLAVKLFTANGTEVADGGTTSQPVKTIELQFTGALKKLSYNGLMLTAHDEVIILGDAPNQPSYDNSRFTIDISGLPAIPGDHSFMVNAGKMKTKNGGKAVGTKTVNWKENLAGTAPVTINIAPNELCGTTNPASGNLQYGTQQIKATPAEGYKFVRWTGDYDQTLTESATLQLEVWKETAVTAWFAPLTYVITIECEEHGILKGYTTGTYTYGEDILLAAQAEPGYLFDCWLKDGRQFSSLQSTTDRVDGSHTYTARFTVNPLSIDGVLDYSTGPVDIYNLSGMRLFHQVTDIERALRSLPAGIYIVGGKKVMKK